MYINTQLYLYGGIMSDNPLKKFFRQPKIFISLPSKGIYNPVGTIQGEVENIPVYGMTGMDEIVIKTPDALIAGESTVKVFESCCPAVKDGWSVSSLDTDLLLTAIRIATYGNTLSIAKTCPACGEESEYDVDLTNVVDHFNNCSFENKVVLKDLVVKLQPLTYRQTTDFSLRNFQIQQRLMQSDRIQDEDERKSLISTLFRELAELQNEIFAASIDSVDIGMAVVTERSYINEWIQNCDSNILDDIKTVFNKNKDVWRVPPIKIKCTSCDAENSVVVDLDSSSFFAKA